MEIVHIQTGNTLVIAPKENIDTINAPAFQQDIIASLQRYDVVTLDLQDVSYVSSAGLRAFLLGKKTADAKGGELNIINVSSTVRNILEISGFAALFNI